MSKYYNIYDTIVCQLLEKFDLNIKYSKFLILNIQNSNILKETVNPKVVKEVGNILTYYSPTHIENRNDTNCLKVLFFIRNKILYNFLNEHIDSNSFIQNCFNISKEEFKNFYENEISTGLVTNVEDNKN